MHFGSYWATYWHFLPILSHARPKTNANKVLRWVFSFVGNKTFDFSSKNSNFLPKNDKKKLAFLFILGLALPAHLVPCWLVVVARGLHLARHLFTLLYQYSCLLFLYLNWGSSHHHIFFLYFVHGDQWAYCWVHRQAACGDIKCYHSTNDILYSSHYIHTLNIRLSPKGSKYIAAMSGLHKEIFVANLCTYKYKVGFC